MSFNPYNMVLLHSSILRFCLPHLLRPHEYHTMNTTKSYKYHWISIDLLTSTIPILKTNGPLPIEIHAHNLILGMPPPPPQYQHYKLLLRTTTLPLISLVILIPILHKLTTLITLKSRYSSTRNKLHHHLLSACACNQPDQQQHVQNRVKSVSIGLETP